MIELSATRYTDPPSNDLSYGCRLCELTLTVEDTLHIILPTSTTRTDLATLPVANYRVSTVTSYRPASRPDTLVSCITDMPQLPTNCSARRHRMSQDSVTTCAHTLTASRPTRVQFGPGRLCTMHFSSCSLFSKTNLYYITTSSLLVDRHSPHIKTSESEGGKKRGLTNRKKCVEKDDDEEENRKSFLIISGSNIICVSYFVC